MIGRYDITLVFGYLSKILGGVPSLIEKNWQRVIVKICKKCIHLTELEPVWVHEYMTRVHVKRLVILRRLNCCYCYIRDFIGEQYGACAIESEL